MAVPCACEAFLYLEVKKNEACFPDSVEYWFSTTDNLFPFIAHFNFFLPHLTLLGPVWRWHFRGWR